MPKILVTYRPPGDALDRLSRIGDIDLWLGDETMPRAELLTRAADSHALYSMLTDRIDVELLNHAPRLVVVSNMAVGYDNVDVAACTGRGIPVGHTPDVLTETVADTAFGLLIAAARRFGEGHDHVRAGRWGQWEPNLLWGAEINGSTLGVVGFGRIGMAVARRAAGFGMQVVFTSRRGDAAAGDTGAIAVEFSDLLATADHVIVAVPLSDETHHMFDERAFESMKSTATLVNISRGPTVDTAALIAALRSGQIAAAGLDVVDPEPLPGGHPLLALPNAFVIPHLGSSTARTRIAMANLAADNIAAAFAGRPLPASVNPDVVPRPPATAL
jgi:lactate dehydrogenase-like 2-hydroxyacid dehydrogenase